MNNDKSGKFELIKVKLEIIKEWVLDHGKIVLPVALVVCLALTIIIALTANRQASLEKQAQAVALENQAKEELTAESNALEAPAYSLEENAHSEINTLISDYYNAMAKGDLLTVCSMNSYIDDVEKIRLEEQSKYIESYPSLDVYTKPGLVENAYVVYVCSATKFFDLEQTLPGMQTYYVSQKEDGNYDINDGTYDEAVYEYIKTISLQDDVVDLNNHVVVEYNDLLSENENVSEFVAYLKEKINEEVGVMLADLESDNTVIEEEVVDEEPDPNAAVVVTKVKATDVVNIRKSDSENADKLDKAQIGQEFTLIEEKANGWSEIEFNGQSAFIKSEFLEAVSTVTIGGGDDTDSNTGAADSGDTTVKGTVKVNDSGVRLRESASTDAEIIVTMYAGTTLDLIEAMQNGWSKVKYDGKVGYVKSEFLD